MEYFGYAGGILNIDLCAREISKEALEPELIQKFIGGWGLNWHLMARHLKACTEPFSPDNPIVIGAGVFNGTPIPTSGKFQMATKMANPANVEMDRYTVAAGSSGSKHFAKMLKYAGYDHLVITGRSESPVYLRVASDKVEILPAEDLWGMDIYETTDLLRKRHGPCGVVAIGKGGENLASQALAITDKRNTLARYGGAANMGYKRLKAIVTQGTGNLKIADRKGLIAMVRKDMARLRKIPDILAFQAHHHWGLSQEWQAYYPSSSYFDTLVGRYGCSSCPVGCRTVHEIKEGEFAGTVMQTSQYMLAPIYGRRLELKDYRAALKLMDVCNRLGICFTTTAGMLRFLCRLQERGLIDERRTDGIKMKLGDVHAYIAFAEKIASREGIGDVMANGWYALSKEVGVNAWEDPDGDGIVKGTSCLFDARFTAFEGTRFENVVNPRGGHHLHPSTYLPMQTLDQIRQDYERHGTPPSAIQASFTDDNFKVGTLQSHLEDWEAVLFSLGVCCTPGLFGVYNIQRLTDYYRALTGIDRTPEELKKSAERAWNLYKLLNVREGFDRKDDVVPEIWRRTVEHPIKTKKGEIRMRDYFRNPLELRDLEQMQDDYYRERGWDVEKGVPTNRKVKELGLEACLNSNLDKRG